MNYVDIHMHLLSGVDDGAENEIQMQEIIDAAYADGTRTICATKHFHPGYFGDNRNAVEDAFTELKNYAKKYSDLQLCLGNELRYSSNCLDWLNNGNCMTLNGSRYVLVDFLESDDSEYIVGSALKLLNAGYTNLHVLFSGKYPPNPVELLNGKYFERILDAVRDVYDYIIIDTPPLGMVIDAAVIAAKCDSAIMVIGNTNVKYTQAQDVVSQLENSGCNVLCVVLNNADNKRKGYYKKKGSYGYY